MPDLKWTVRVHRWTWTYAFARAGTVTWRDPYNGMHGNGSWRLDGGKLITRWIGSKTWESWDVPIDPDDATGECHMGGEVYNLRAVALNYHLGAGDVVYTGDPIIRGNGTAASIVYPDEVRTGGTVAWICRNPGNIRDGSRFGAYKGKALNVRQAGSYAIFPDETTGLMAVVAVLRGYGGVTIRQAIRKYAPPGDGQNNPDQYATAVAGRLRLGIDTNLNSMSDEQVLRMATVMTGIENTTEGTRYSPVDPNLPFELRQRLTRLR